MCGAGCGPCAAAGAVCVGMVRGCREAEKRVPHACRCGRGSRLVAPRPRARGNPLCVCARHTARRTLRGVQLARQGPGAGVGEKGARTRRSAGGSGPPHPRVCACDRRAGGGRAPWSPRDASSQRNRKFAGGGGITSGRKISNWSSRAKPDEAGGVRLGWGPRVRREARLPHASRAWSKREKGGRPKGTDGRGGAPDARPKTHALQNDTPPPQSPRRRACCKVFRLRRRGGRWVGGNGERRWRGAPRRRPPPLPAARARARGARSGLCRPPPGYFSTIPG